MNIQEIVIAIRKHGLNDYEIAERCGLHQSNVCRLRNGLLKTVGWEKGKRLEALYNKLQEAANADQQPKKKAKARRQASQPQPKGLDNRTTGDAASVTGR